MAVTEEQKVLVQTTFGTLAINSAQTAETFYGRLFQLDPAVQALFVHDMQQQGIKLMQLLATAVAGLDDLPAIVPAVQALGRRHVGYGVQKEHYATVGTALLWTLQNVLGTDYTPEVENAWTSVYGILSQTAIDAAYA